MPLKKRKKQNKEKQPFISEEEWKKNELSN